MLNMDYVNARKLLLPTAERVVICLVGCGGTGSWLAPAVVRVVKKMLDDGKNVSLYFIDPDYVERKNVYRQNFAEAEIGLNKAVSLAHRYGLTWGVPIGAFPQRFKGNMLNKLHYELMVMIGCVDNAAARRTIRDYVHGGHGYYQKVWWLDCGNEESAGQVLLGCGGKFDKEKMLGLPGRCGWLPSPSMQHPDLMDEQVKEESLLSCAEMAIADSQGMAINQRIAAEAADYLVRMLITQDLRKMATYIDLESGSTRSRYITDECVSTETEA